MRPRITQELLQLATAGSLPAGAALKRVCRTLFGVGLQRRGRDPLPDCSRRRSLARSPSGWRIATTASATSEIKVQDLVEWLGWLDRFDPMSAAMIDLHYFAGLTTKQTAAALRLAPEVVIRDLRFAKAWLQTKLI